MERLTKRIGGNVYYINGKYDETIPAECEPHDVRKILQALADYEDTNHTPEECAAAFVERDNYKILRADADRIRESMMQENLMLFREKMRLKKELAAYRAAEQDGTLLRMAYPVGSYVFVSPNKGKSFHKARVFGKNKKGAYLVWICDESLDENEKHIVENPMTKFFYDWFHKVYSKEEAEAALKEQEGHNG